MKFLINSDSDWREGRRKSIGTRLFGINKNRNAWRKSAVAFLC